MSGPYGYGGYGGYAPPGGYRYPPAQQPRPGYPPGPHPPPGGPAPAGYQPRPQYPPGQQGGYQPYQQPTGYGTPGFRPPTTQPQGYTPVGGPPAGYLPSMQQPPPMVTAGQAPNVTSANRPMYTQPARAAPLPPISQPPRPQMYATVPQSFPELHNMSKEELEKLLESDTALVEYFESREDIKRLQEARQKVVEKNEELATSNISLKPELEEKQQELVELYAELESQRNELNDLQQQQQALADHYAPHNILARLKIAASEVEDESEAISENFLNGDIAIDEFLKTYIPKKSLCHSRRAKEEKMERMGI